MQTLSLVAVVRLLKLDISSLKQAEERFEQLLQLVASILLKQVDPAIVKECAQTLAHSVSESPASLQVIPSSVSSRALP